MKAHKTLFVLIALLFALCGCAGTPETSAQESSDLAEFRTRWETVAKTLRDTGATVEPYDETGRYTMRIQMPTAISEHDARKIAQSTRERLHDKAIVYVYDDTRKQKAKATPWGME